MLRMFLTNELVKHYRGEKRIAWTFPSIFFQDTIEWFEKYGVELKTEDDGECFRFRIHHKP
jgi:predicted flavoprotein YhiN